LPNLACFFATQCTTITTTTATTAAASSDVAAERLTLAVQRRFVDEWLSADVTGRRVAERHRDKDVSVV